MDTLDYLRYSPQNNENNKDYLDYCFISSDSVSYVYSLPTQLDSCTHEPVQHSTALLTTLGPYPSPPLTGSALKHTISLPQLSEDKDSTSLEEPSCLTVMHDEQSITHLPLSPPPTVPIATLVLPLHPDNDGECLSSPASSLDLSPQMEHDPLPDDSQEFDGSESQLPTPLSPTDWLTVDDSPLSVPMEQDETSWDEDRNTPQPLCSEPTRSVWSPESPPRNDELDLDSEPSSSPSSSTSWSSELLSDDLPAWDDNWSNPLPLDWAPARGSDNDDDYYMDSGSFSCLDPVISPDSQTSYRRINNSDNKDFHHFLDYPMADLDYEPASFELLQSPVRRSISLQISDQDDSYPEVEELPPPSPPRRTVLPDLGSGENGDGAVSQIRVQPLSSSRVLSLPGADTDDGLLSPVHDPCAFPLSDIALFPPTDTMPEGLGISLIPPTVSPSSSTFSNSSLPEYTNVEDLINDFPELRSCPFPIPTEIPPSGLNPEYSLARLIQICRRTKQAERNARQQEVEQGSLVASILKGLLPPFDGDHIAKRNKIRELQSAAENRTEAKKTRKRERERCREVRTLLSLKLNEMARESESPVQMLEEEEEQRSEVVVERAEPSELWSPGKKWMTSNTNQLVARMVIRRRERHRPLGCSRKNGRNEYVRSPLSKSLHASTMNLEHFVGDDDDGESLDEMEGIMPTEPDDVEMPPISS